MKIRKGFVSNSSSSSFIVVFDTVPTSKEELHELLFGEYDHDDFDCFGHGFTTQTLAEVIWTDLRDAEPVKTVLTGGRRGLYRLFAAFHYDVHDTMQPPANSTREQRRAWFTKKSREAEEAGTEQAQKFLDDHKGKPIFVFEYADDDGTLGETLEHGDVFRALTHVKVNHH